MTKKTHLWPENIVETEGQILVGVVIENQNQKRSNLWYRLGAEHHHLLTKTCDPFVVAMIFNAMRKSTDLYIHGQVSPSLLRNLEEFQAIWNCWLPNRYTKIEINADIEQPQAKAKRSEKSVMAFSGGVDSCFTAWRHHNGSCGRSRRNLRAAIMIHGFDIPLEEKNVFERAAKNSQKILAPLGIKLTSVATNFRNLDDYWNDAHAAGLASCLMLLQEGYEIGLIASTEPYNSMILPWGSNPVTDKLLSSDNFQIIHDGAAFTRSDKIREILNWPEALRYLRVCWEGEEKDRNCGHCEKCIRTILNFRSIGLSLPECFEHDVSDNQIINLKRLNAVQIAYLEQILKTAKAASIRQSWVTALSQCIKQNQHMSNGSKKLLQRIGKSIGFRRHLAQIKPYIES
jgi:hypothetical protein